MDDLLDARGDEIIVDVDDDDDVRFFRKKKRPRQPPREDDDSIIAASPPPRVVIIVVNIILAGAPAHAFGLELFGENSPEISFASVSNRFALCA